LLGTVDDWRQIRRRAEALAEYDMGWWVKSLTFALDQFIAASDGQIAQDVWASFFKYQSTSGSSYVSGWINALFPYIENPRTLEPRRNPFVVKWTESMADWAQGPDTTAFSSGLSTVPFVWKYLGAKLPMELLAGFVGVHQDPDSLALRPAQGWAVRDRKG
jgi:hypothetical protein